MPLHGGASNLSQNIPNSSLTPFNFAVTHFTYRWAIITNSKCFVAIIILNKLICLINTRKKILYFCFYLLRCSSCRNKFQPNISFKAGNVTHLGQLLVTKSLDFYLFKKTLFVFHF